MQLLFLIVKIGCNFFQQTLYRVTIFVNPIIIKVNLTKATTELRQVKSKWKIIDINCIIKIYTFLLCLYITTWDTSKLFSLKFTLENI